MDDQQQLVLRASQHPNNVIARLGFDLRHRYLEECWAPVIGPASVLLLRRLPDLWRNEEPARLTAGDLGRHLGLAGSGTEHTLRRLERFGFARFGQTGEVEVFTTAGPVHADQLDRLPPASRVEHHRMVADQFATALDPDRNSATVSRRLDQLQNRSRPHLHLVR
ncbi:MAG TPA: hypothetical protein VNQ73_16170 [Ilumatobacter sp.]|nr:hypothetical protein [Ilumatobacter sp.]